MLCEKICSVHKNPLNCLLHLIAVIIAIYALWNHSVNLILVAIAIAIIGHVIQYFAANKTEKKTKKKR